MSCFIRQAQGRAFSDPLIGLRVNPSGMAQLCPQAFSCCRSSQCQVDAAGNLFVCDIESRLRKVQSVLDLYREVWNQPFSILPLKNKTVLGQYFSYLDGSGGLPERGQIFQSKCSPAQASPYIWHMAVIAAWRFAADVHVITLGKTGADRLLPHVLASRRDRRPLVFIDQKLPLRLPHVEFDFDVIVNWCEGSMSPLWMDVLAEPVAEPKRTLSGSAEEQFRKRMERFRRSPPLSWAYADTCSRLVNVSVGSGRFS